MWTFSTIFTPWPSITRASTASPHHTTVFRGGAHRRLPFRVFGPQQDNDGAYAITQRGAGACRMHDTALPAAANDRSSRGLLPATAHVLSVPATLPSQYRIAIPADASSPGCAAHGRRVLPQVLFFCPPCRVSRPSFLTCGAHMDFKQLALAARTCRRFEEERPLQMADLEWLVDCARLTPCARNAQQLRYSLVGPGETCQRLFGMTKWAAALKDWGGPFPGERPTGFIVMSMPKNAGDLVWLDTGIAAQTINLAASSRDWGCCMIASFDHAGVSELVRLPEELRPTLVLGLGVAKEVRRVADVPESGALGYWRDADQVHYVPKLALDKLVLNRF